MCDFFPTPGFFLLEGSVLPWIPRVALCLELAESPLRTFSFAFLCRENSVFCFFFVCLFSVFFKVIWSHKVFLFFRNKRSLDVVFLVRFFLVFFFF